MTGLIKLVTVDGRELGIDLMLISQSSFSLDPYLLDNASTIVCFAVGNNSAGIMQKAMNMTDEELRLLQKAPQGVAAVLKRSSFSCPVLVKIPNIAIQKVSKETRDRIMLRRLEEMRSKYLTVVGEEEKGEKMGVSQVEELGSDKIHVLKDYAIAPYESVTEKATKLNYNPATLVGHLKGLQEQGYLEPRNVNIGKGVGIIRLYKLTDRGIQIVGKQNLVGRGEMAHGYWMQIIKRVYEARGLRVSVEKYFSDVNGLIDVAVGDSNIEKLIAIEIALTNKYSHECDNIEKCLRAGFQHVMSCAPSEFQLKGIRKEALNRSDNLEKVEFKLLKEFYNEYTSRTRA